MTAVVYALEEPVLYILLMASVMYG